MGEEPKRIEPEPRYPCCQCYDEYSWPKEDLRWYKNDLWCANCLWSDLEPFVPKCDRELAEARADADHWKSECNARQRMVHESRARIDHLECIVDEMTEEQAALCAEGQSTTELVAAKDKLIEQMREALTWALTEARSTHGEQLIRAALRAADGGE
jgi:hypothetical protein